MGTDRFVCASSALSLAEPLKQERKRLFLGLCLAVVAHLLLTQITGLREEEKVLKPLTTKFIKRQPRLTKPLELKKRPRPKRRPLQRKMVSIKARTDRQQRMASFLPTQVLQGLARPSVMVGRGTALQTTALEPQAVAGAITGSREAKDALDMSLELLDIDALDTGRYQAMVIQDPDDKRNIKGFLYLGPSWLSDVIDRDYHKRIARQMYGYRRLIRKINEWTGIKAYFLDQLTYDCEEFFHTPWVYLTMHIAYHLIKVPVRGPNER